MKPTRGSLCGTPLANSRGDFLDVTINVGLNYPNQFRAFLGIIDEDEHGSPPLVAGGSSICLSATDAYGVSLGR